MDGRHASGKRPAWLIGAALLAGPLLSGAEGQLRVDANARAVTVEVPAADFRFEAKSLSGPERIVLDIEGAGLDIAKQLRKLFEADSKPVLRVRVGSIKAGSMRVVVDLAGQTPFAASRVPGRPAIRLELGGGGGAAAPASTLARAGSAERPPAPASTLARAASAERPPSPPASILAQAGSAERPSTPASTLARAGSVERPPAAASILARAGSAERPSATASILARAGSAERPSAPASTLARAGSAERPPSAPASILARAGSTERPPPAAPSAAADRRAAGPAPTLESQTGGVSSIADPRPPRRVIVLAAPGADSPESSPSLAAPDSAEPRPRAMAPARPQQQKPAAADGHDAVPPVRKFELSPRVGILGEAPLSLAEAVFLAIENNRDIQARRIDVEDAGLRLRGARGAFEPVFGSSTSFQKQTQPVSSTLGGSATGSVFGRAWQTAPSISGASPRLGGLYEAAFNSQKYTTNNSFATLNPSYPSSLTLQYTQPLWRNLRYDSRRHGIEAARANRQLADESFKRQVVELIERTEIAYWELWFAKRDLAVQLEALAIARGQDEANRRQLSLGEMAAIEVVAAQTQLANFEIAVYAGQDGLTRAENNLKTLMLGERSAPLWTSALLPTTEPEAAGANPPPLEDAVAEALAQRPETAEVRIAVGVNQAAQKLNREQLKPQVDLIGRYSPAGLAGRSVVDGGANPLGDSFTPALIRLNQLSALAGLPAIGLAPGAGAPSLLVGGYGTSLNRLFHNDFPTALIELRIALPIGNSAAKASLALAMTDARRIEHRRQALEQSIEAEVRNALQALDSARRRLQAARVKQQSAEEQYRSEERRFQRAASTLFLVQQRQLTMVTSRSQVHRAETDLSEAAARFDLSRGTIARRHGVAIK